jgi:zinc finger CCCH domain-containing protein 13
MQLSNVPQGDEPKWTEGPGSQEPGKSAEPTSAPEDPNAAQTTMEGSGDGSTMYGNNMMQNMGGMPGQFGYGFNGNQGNFNNGMGWNGMNSMGGMPNMMGGGNFNMNPMGMFHASHNSSSPANRPFRLQYEHVEHA